MDNVNSSHDTANAILQDKCVITGVSKSSSLFLGHKGDCKSDLGSIRLENVNNIASSESTSPIDKSHDSVRDGTGAICISSGDVLTLDGATGRILKGAVPQMEPAIDRDFTTLLQWTNQYRRVDIMSTCDSTTDVCDAAQFGAEGIGLLRIEKLYVQKCLSVDT